MRQRHGAGAEVLAGQVHVSLAEVVVGASGDDDRVRPTSRHGYQGCPARDATCGARRLGIDALVGQGLEKPTAGHVVPYAANHDDLGALTGSGHGLVEALSPGTAM